MDKSIIVVMQKNMETGILEKELFSYEIGECADCIVNIFAEEQDGEYTAHLKLSTDELTDWQFNAVYDYYDMDIYNELVSEVREVNNCFEPTWEFIFKLPENEAEAEAFIEKLCKMHCAEMTEVMETIEDKEEEYK